MPVVDALDPPEPVEPTELIEPAAESADDSESMLVTLEDLRGRATAPGAAEPGARELEMGADTELASGGRPETKPQSVGDRPGGVMGAADIAELWWRCCC